MIAANNVTLRIGKKALFEDVNIKFTEGNCYGLIGANGAGKSTFLKILSGQLETTSGDITITPGQRLSFLQQDHFKYDAYPVLDTVIMGNKRLYEIMKEKEAIYAKEDFSDEKTQIILKCKGYDCTNLSQCICRLIQKLQSDPDFPHEIGLFLGYPAEDVKGFIENKAACSKCSGCWKVYGDEQAARILFKKYKKCTEIYCRRWKSGVAVEQLTITI